MISTLRPPACVRLRRRHPGRVLPACSHRRAHARSGCTTPRLVGCVASGPTWVFRGPADGPRDRAHLRRRPLVRHPSVSSTSARARARRRDVLPDRRPDQRVRLSHGLDRRILNDGDMIGDHTWNYGGDVVAGGSAMRSRRSPAAATAIRQRDAAGSSRAYSARRAATSRPALLSTARSLGFTTIQWDIDPRDWATPGSRSDLRHRSFTPPTTARS